MIYGLHNNIEKFCIKNNIGISYENLDEHKVMGMYDIENDKIIVNTNFTLYNKYNMNNIDLLNCIVLHELIHWTGHASRLDRIKRSYFINRRSYKKEETIANEGMFRIGLHFGLESNILLKLKLKIENFLQYDMKKDAFKKIESAIGYIKERE